MATNENSNMVDFGGEGASPHSNNQAFLGSKSKNESCGKGSTSSIVGKMKGLLGKLMQLFSLIMRLIALILGLFDMNGLFNDDSLEDIISDIFDWVVDGLDDVGFPNAVKEDIKAIIDFLCDNFDDETHENHTTPFRFPEITAMVIVSVMLKLACSGVEGSFQAALEIAIDNPEIRDIKRRQETERRSWVLEGKTEFEINTLENLQREELDSRLIPIYELFARSAAPFVMKQRKIRGVDLFLDIATSPVAPFLKVYKSDISQILLAAFDQKPIPSKDPEAEYDLLRSKMLIIDPTFEEDTSGQFNLLNTGRHPYWAKLSQQKAQGRITRPTIAVETSSDNLDASVLTTLFG